MAGGVLVPGEEKAAETEQRSRHTHTHKCREAVNKSEGRGEEAGYSLTPEPLPAPMASLSDALCPPPPPPHAVAPLTCPTHTQPSPAWTLPEDGVMGVAMRPLALMAAMCCICTAAMVAMGLR